MEFILSVVIIFGIIGIVTYLFCHLIFAAECENVKDDMQEVIQLVNYRKE